MILSHFIYPTIITEVNVSATVGMSATVEELSATVEELSATVEELSMTVENLTMFEKI